MMYRLFVRFAIAILLGIIITLYILQYNERFKTYLQRTCIEQYEQMFDCCMNAQVTGVHLFSPKIILEDIIVTDTKNPNWSWRCKQAVCTVSWINLIVQYPQIPFDLQLLNVTLYSTYSNGSLAIQSHIETMLGAPVDSPLALHSLEVRKGHCTIEDKENRCTVSVPFSCQAGIFNSQMKTTCKIDTASIAYNDMFVCSDVHASLQTVTRFCGTPHTDATLKAECKLLYKQNSKLQCYIDGSWQEGQGDITLTSDTRELAIEHTTLVTNTTAKTRHTSRTHATLPVELLQHYSPYLNSGQLTGTATLLLHHDTDGTYHDTYGTLSSTDERRYGTITTDFKQTDTGFNGIATWHNTLMGRFSGSWTCNPTTRSCTASLSNDTSIALWPSKYWTILPRQCTITAYNNDTTVRLTIESNETHSVTDSVVTTSAHIAITPEQCSLEAHHEGHTIQAACTLIPEPHLTHIAITDATNTQQFSFGPTSTAQQYTGTLMFPLLKKVLNSFSENSIQGTGTCNVHLATNSTGLQAGIDCKDASVRLMGMYNILNKLHASCTLDTEKSSLVIKNGLIGLHKGKLLTHQTTIHYDPLTATPTFVHAPLLFDNLLLTAEKEVFIVVSGSLVMLKNPTIPLTIRGTIILDRGQIKKNIFANTLTKNVVSSLARSYGPSAHDCALDIHIQTDKPLQVKTPFLQASLKADIDIKGTVEHPLISGTVSIVDGSLGFPSKPLYITHAHLYFIPEHLYDPRIELVARGKIKKYNVTMRVTGSLDHPTITFESTPKLAEEKIITLILAGSEEGSFPMVMPTLIMHNIHQLLFGPEPTEYMLERTFKNILAPLKSISIVPSFDDQTGRGGLRGAVEINVNERLSGKLQKNFSLTEDTKCEVEYLLSDDMSIRATKDERGDLGGELEMRWKF